MEDYKIVPEDPLVKIETEAQELRDYLKELEGKKENKTKEIKIKEEKILDEINKIDKEFEKGVKVSKNINDKMSYNTLIKELIKLSRVNQEIINTIVVSNLELQTKLSETIVSINELSKEIRRLINLFKEAAMEFMLEGESETPKKKEKVEHTTALEDKFSLIEKQNNKIIELLSKIEKALEESKKETKVTPPPFPFLPPK